MNEVGNKNKRPVLRLPLSNCEKVIEVLSAIGVLLIFLIVITSWESVPGRIPTHFGSSGLPDAWGGKGSLVFLPIVVLVLYLLLSIVSKYPHTFNYPLKITEENARVQYQNARHLMAFLKTEITWSFTYIQWKTIQVAFGKAEGLGNIYLPILLIVIFGTIGVYLYKAKQYK